MSSSPVERCVISMSTAHDVGPTIRQNSLDVGPITTDLRAGSACNRHSARRRSLVAQPHEAPGRGELKKRPPRNPKTRPADAEDRDTARAARTDVLTSQLIRERSTDP
jgi:hypothetical protein